MKILQVKQDKDTKECYLDLEAILEGTGIGVEFVHSYSLEERKDENNLTCITLKLYDHNGKIIKFEKDENETSED